MFSYYYTASECFAKWHNLIGQLECIIPIANYKNFFVFSKEEVDNYSIF